MNELEQLQEIKEDTESLELNFRALSDKLSLFEQTTSKEVPVAVDEALSSMFFSLANIFRWVTEAVEAIEQGETPEVPLSVIEKFLQELKLVFEKYSASIEVKSGEAYGESYGGADVIQFTATLDGVTEKKAIALDNSILTAEDLV